MSTQTISRIRLAVPDMEFADVESGLRQSIESGWLTNGPQVEAFEASVAAHVGTRYAIATSSGTTALHLALLALGVGEGDEVIVPDYTFPATATVVLHCGARPVLADVDGQTFNLDPNDAAKRITPRTKAIMPVHQFGLPADMGPILELAERHSLFVIEDAACALGASYHGSPCGALAHVGCFSFHPRKVITTGEGGAITTNDEAIANFCRLWRNHGMVAVAGRKSFLVPGYNHRMDELSATLGVAQMKRLDYIVKRRRELAHRLTEAIGDLAWLRPPVEASGHLHSYQSYVVVLEEGVDQDSVITQLDAAGVEATPGAAAVHAQPYAREWFGTDEVEFPVSAALYSRSLTLPLYPRMTEEEIEQVVEALRGVKI